MARAAGSRPFGGRIFFTPNGPGYPLPGRHQRRRPGPSGRVEVPLPAVPGHDGLLPGVQPAAVAHRGIPLDVPDGPHARDHGGDGLLAEHIAQRDLGDLVLFDAEVGDQCVDVLPDLRLPVTAEEAVAEVAVGERRVGECLPYREPADGPGTPLGCSLTPGVT